MLPITKATLYKTGIGYFERAGTIKENRLKLSFKSNSMNDILASLTILTTKSQVTGVSYESQDIDLETILEDALVKIPQNESLVSLIKQLIGCKVSLLVGRQKHEGTVLGIQGIPEPVEETFITDLNIVLKDESGVNIFPIHEISAFDIIDEKMKKELEFFIEKVYEGKKKDKKILTIFFDNVPQGGDNVNINYLHEIPAWKCSYRLLYGESKEDLMIQGWALVDNVQDEDWNSVNLSLIAGLPMNFIYDLYSPNWISRPEVERKDKYDLNVVDYEEAEEELDYLGAGKPRLPPAPAGAPPPLKKRAKRPDRLYSLLSAGPSSKSGLIKEKQTAKKAESSVKVTTEAESAGDYFQYSLSVPVSIQRNQSSLVPILQTYIKGKKLSIYNESARKNNPMLCIEIENTSDLTLEEGTLSIFDGTKFDGEAMLPFMKKGEKRRVPYAVDLAITVNKEVKSHSLKYHSINLKETFLMQNYYNVEEVTYLLKNKEEFEDKEVIVEHPIVQGYELFDTVDPFEKSKSFYRFKINMPAKKSVKLLVKTRYLNYSSINYKDINEAAIKTLQKLKLIDLKTKTFLTTIMKLVRKAKSLEQQLTKARKQKMDIFSDQGRLRENIKSVGASASEIRLKEKYITKMEQQENSLEELIEKIATLEKDYKAHRVKIDDLIRSQEFHST